jgi:hypothetical protein
MGYNERTKRIDVSLQHSYEVPSNKQSSAVRVIKRNIKQSRKDLIQDQSALPSISLVAQPYRHIRYQTSFDTLINISFWSETRPWQLHWSIYDSYYFVECLRDAPNGVAHHEHHRQLEQAVVVQLLCWTSHSKLFSEACQPKLKPETCDVGCRGDICMAMTLVPI